ncbi:tellurite resistance TerB family protein [Jannaschia aquimarina]|uniref:Tellurite resistance protein TerB n=1 Tax=Jannaschia aquimarina TaxID=935700 RepID=A0A0D1EJ68_9RHOB|nr:tellurite resistance TerB family protein [Jannaschia aquimarina]KIT17674.1 Tellurite resistance protein TerB [Jannaschia aquimarina]SNS79355.1 Tellurite resistance protein [Jannaschia aquimarina]
MAEITNEQGFSPQDALVALMITVSVSDATIRTAELLTIEQIVDHLPIFAEYDADRMQSVSQTVFDLLEEEDGLDAIIGLVRNAVPSTHWETAYALSCDVAAADGNLRQAELRLLQELRHELEIDPLHAAAIERGARARHLSL